MGGIIERIRAYPEKGAAGADLSQARFIKNLGLEGDFHAKGGERQISLLLIESREQVSNSKEKGLCFSRFSENITIRDLDTTVLTPGMRLSAGKALLEITGETKHCHEECILYEAGKHCQLAGQSLFARVVESGLVLVGDRISEVVI